jgi:DNA primase
VTRDARQEIAEITEVNEAAARYYRDQLQAPDHTGPRDYLTARGFSGLLRESPWSIGYAPDGWTNLHSHLKQHGYSDETMLTAGLITISRRGTPIDRFRDRITFGIRDLDSRLVGFTARVAPTAPATTPKYLNTPRTPAYDKSSVLFGLGEAQTSHVADAVVVTEGPLDARAVGAMGDGRWAPLALCGTSLTAMHARRVEQLGRPAVLAFDDDSAGRRALERAIATMTPITGEPWAVRIGLGQDPAGLYERLGPEALMAALETATPASDLVVTRILQKWGSTVTAPHRTVPCLREASVALSKLGISNVARHAACLSEALSLEPSTVTHELARAVSARETGRQPDGLSALRNAEVTLRQHNPRSVGLSV